MSKNLEFTEKEKDYIFQAMIHFKSDVNEILRYLRRLDSDADLSKYEESVIEIDELFKKIFAADWGIKEKIGELVEVEDE